MCKFKQKRFYPSIALLFLLNFFIQAQAAISLQDSITIDLGTWSGSGDIDIDSNDFCVLSEDEDSAEDYRVRITNNPFVLSGSIDTLPITIVYEDTQINGSETLTAASFTTINKTGLVDCATITNGKFRLVITEADLQAATAGTYSTTLSVEFDQVNASGNVTSTFTAAVAIPSLVRISGINDIDLGTWDGVNDISADTPVCIYKNAAGAYSTTLIGNGADNAFTLTDGSKTIPYFVRYTDGNGLTKNAPKGIILTGFGGSSQSLTCNNGTNGKLDITIPNTILTTFTAGTYTGVLTMLVAPE